MKPKVNVSELSKKDVKRLRFPVLTENFSLLITLNPYVDLPTITKVLHDLLRFKGVLVKLPIDKSRAEVYLLPVWRR